MREDPVDEIIRKLRNKEIKIDDFFQQHTDKDVMLERMLNRAPEDLDTAPGDYIWDSLSPCAIELALAYIVLEDALKRGFAQTSYGQFITYRAAEHGVIRKEATKASGKLTIEGSYGTVVKVGDLFSNTVTDGATELTKYYAALEDGQIDTDGIIEILVEAVVSGERGNALAREINNNISGISGVRKVYNKEPFNSGVEEESDASLLKRYLERVRHPPSSGNKHDYIRWAKEISGVEQCIVKSLWKGPGTVKLVLLGKNGAILPSEILNNVKLHIDPTDGEGDGTAPIGALVTVITPILTPITVTIPGLLLEKNYTLDSVKSGIKKALEEQLIAMPPDSIIRHKDIESAINAVPGTLDFQDVLINGKKSNIQLEEDQKAILGEVVYI